MLLKDGDSASDVGRPAGRGFEFRGLTSGGDFMNRICRRAVKLGGVFAVFVLSLVSAPLRAQDHVVSDADLRRAVAQASEARQRNCAQVQRFFSREPVRKVLKSARLDPTKIERAIPALSDEELARLAARTNKVETDIAGGALTNEQLTYIVIALATAVVVILIVER
jgi:hypothetical protein